MRIDYLREFVEVAYCLNYSKAAKNLGTSQSSISKHVQSLEKRYGALLFERDTASVSLTPFGIALVQESIALLDACDRFESRVEELGDLYRKSLVVGGMHYNPKIMRLLDKAQRDVDSGAVTVPLRLVSQLSDPLVDSLKIGRIDVALTLRDEALIDDEDVHCVDVLEDPLFALMRSSHPLAHRQSVTFVELSEWTFLKPSGSYFVLGNEALEEMFSRSGIRVKDRIVFVKDVQGFRIIDFMDGVTFVEGGVASTISSESGLISVPIADAGASFPIVAACRAQDARAVSFVDALRA